MLCGDESRRFLPFAAADLHASEIDVPSALLLLEDVAFCEKLVRVASPVILDEPVLTDSRKFVTMGIWRSLARVLLIILCVEFRLSVLPRGFFQDVR